MYNLLSYILSNSYSLFEPVLNYRITTNRKGIAVYMLSKSIKYKSYPFFLYSFLCLSFIASAAPPITVKVAVTQRLTNLYQSVLKQDKKTIIEFTVMDLKETTNGFTSLVILKQALNKVGLTTKFEFVISPTYKRSLLLVQSGDALLTLSTLREGYTPPETLKSSVLIGSQDMVRGIYGLKSNHALMKVQTLGELKKLSAVTNLAWGGDINALRAIEPAKFDLVSSLSSIFMRIAYRNTDFTLLDLPIGTPEFQRQYKGVILIPVPGLLINTNTTRHFLISKRHPDSQTVYQALEKGLKIMREQGLIKRYYQQVKKFPSDLPSWKILNNAATGHVNP